MGMHNLVSPTICVRCDDYILHETIRLSPSYSDLRAVPLTPLPNRPILNTTLYR